MPKALKIIITVVVAILAIILGLLWENSFTLAQPRVRASLLDLPTNVADFEVQTDKNRKWHTWSEGEKPRYLKSIKALTVTYKGDLFLSVSSGTVFKFVEINSDLAHIKLLKGTMGVDKRFSSNNVFLQSQKVAIIAEPFSYGLMDYDGDLVKVEAIVGNQVLKISDSPNQAASSYLTVGHKLSYAEQANTAPVLTATATKSIPKNLPQVNVDNYLIKNSQLISSYKRQSEIKVPQVLEMLVLNPVKRNASQVNRLIQDLDSIREQILLNQDQVAQQNLLAWQEDFNGLKLSESRITASALKSWLQLYGSFSEDSPYYSLKEVIVSASALVLSSQDLVQLWSYTVDSSSNWDGATLYFSEVTPTVIKSGNLKTIKIFKERVISQLSRYPEKNIASASKAVADLNKFLIEKKALSYEQAANELVELIKSVQTFADNEETFSHEQAVTIVNNYISLIEQYLIAADSTESPEEYLRNKIPSLPAFLLK